MPSETPHSTPIIEIIAGWPMIWKKCCTVWPLALHYKPGRCGICGSNEFTNATQTEVDEFKMAHDTPPT